MMPDFELPDWLSTDPDALISELMQTYSGTGKMFDPTGIARSYNKSIDTAMGMGGQIADNAMRESIARAGLEGGGANSAMVKAQSMLPVYEHTAGLRKDKALAVADVRAREAGMRAQLASAIGQMRTSYLSMLADTYMRGKTAQASWVQGNRQFGLQEREQSLREDMAMRMEEGATTRTGPGPGAGMMPFQGQISRAPNNSGMGNVEYTPEFKEYLAQSGQTGPGIGSAPPRYSGAAGPLAGGALDTYETDWRNIISMATGVPAYNANTQDIQGAFDGGYATDSGGQYDPVTGRYRGKQVVRTY